MDGFNQVTLVGSVGKDAEVRMVGENGQKATFSLATNRTFKTKAGEKKTETDWHTIEVWNERAKFAGAYVKKGGLLLVTGTIVYEKYTDKEGHNREKTIIKADQIKLLPNGKGNPNAVGAVAETSEAVKQTEQYAATSGGATQTVTTSEAFTSTVDDDLPF